MDPIECLRRFQDAMRQGKPWDAADEARDVYRYWVAIGGFPAHVRHANDPDDAPTYPVVAARRRGVMGYFLLRGGEECLCSEVVVVAPPRSAVRLPSFPAAPLTADECGENWTPEECGDCGEAPRAQGGAS